MGQTGLHLHVSLEDRQNLNADAIQGELFSNVDTEEIKRGYRGTVASKVPASRTDSSIIGRASRLLSRPSRRLMAPVHADCTRLRMW